jgi:hypothetical protein
MRAPIAGRFFVLALVCGCRSTAPDAGPAAASPDALARAAESYVRLALAFDLHEPGYVDSYYGPAAWKTDAQARRRGVLEIQHASSRLLDELRRRAPATDTPQEIRLRHRWIARHVEALVSRINTRGGRPLRFDEETRALYDVVAPRVSDEDLRRPLDELDRRLPGRGPLAPRYDTFTRRFVIPRARLEDVFTRAVDACRERTRSRVALPAGERVRIEYVAGQPWGAYNKYGGSYESVIQINRDLPITIDRALDIACHEGYPGHHAQNVLVDQQVVRGRDWVEFSVAARFSPQAFLAEAAASYAIELAFPADERLAFERDVLFPLAGLDPREAGTLYATRRLVDRLGAATVEGARRYLDGALDGRGLARWLERYAAMPGAEGMRPFLDRYRSYVISYTIGRDLVRRYVEEQGAATADTLDARWERFRRLSVLPLLPSDLAK